MKPALDTDPDRSKLMKRVRQRGTGAESNVACGLRSLGIGYRRNVRSLPGTPDFANKKRGWAIFVNGCFWHGHTNCRRATKPTRNKEFWAEKFTANRKRDARKICELRKARLRVLVVWECQSEAAPILRDRLRKNLRPMSLPDQKSRYRVA